MKLRNLSIFPATGVIAAGLLAATLAVSAAQAKTVEIKLAHQFPTTHFASKIFIAPYIKLVQAKSGGRIKFREFPAQQLAKAKGMLDAVKNRVTDMGFVGVTYVTEKMPLTSVIEIPGLFSDIKKASRAFLTLAKQDLAKYEHLPQKVRPLSVGMTPPYQIVLRKMAPLNDISEIKGLKLRVPGNTGVLTANAIGAVPVKVAPADLYLALERGTVDGMLLTSASVNSYKQYEVAKTITSNASLGTVAFVLFINENVWKSLPADLQKVLADAGETVAMKAAAVLDAVIAKSNKAVAANGMKVVTLQPKILEQMNGKLATVEEKWLQQAGGRNKNAGAVLKRYKALLAE